MHRLEAVLATACARSRSRGSSPASSGFPAIGIGFACWSEYRSRVSLEDFGIFRTAALAVIHGRSPYVAPDPARVRALRQVRLPAGRCAAVRAVRRGAVGAGPRADVRRRPRSPSSPRCASSVSRTGAATASRSSRRPRSTRSRSAPSRRFCFSAPRICWRLSGQPGRSRGWRRPSRRSSSSSSGRSAIWLLVTRRWRAAVICAGVGLVLLVGGWAVIDFAGLRSYPTILHVLQQVEVPVSYSLVALFGLSGGAATAMTVVLSLAAVVGDLVGRARRGRRSARLRCRRLRLARGDAAPLDALPPAALRPDRALPAAAVGPLVPAAAALADAVEQLARRDLADRPGARRRRRSSRVRTLCASESSGAQPRRRSTTTCGELKTTRAGSCRTERLLERAVGARGRARRRDSRAPSPASCRPAPGSRAIRLELRLREELEAGVERDPACERRAGSRAASRRSGLVAKTRPCGPAAFAAACAAAAGNPS